MTRILAVLATAIGLLPTFAHADDADAQIDRTWPLMLEVTGTSSRYTRLETEGEFLVRAFFFADVELGGRILRWWVKPYFTSIPGGPPLSGMDAYAFHKEYPVGDRPRVVSKQVDMTLPVGVLQGLAVAKCNELADDLRRRGQSSDEIFRRRHDTEIYMDVLFHVKRSGAGSGQPLSEGPTARRPLVVSCLPTISGTPIPPGATRTPQGASRDPADERANQPQGRRTNPPEVTGATLRITENDSPAGTCMLRTQTAIRGNKPNMEVHYRFVHSRGERSPFFTARTNRNGLAVVTHNWPVPITRGRERGWLRVEGNAPTDFRSTRVQYSMNCTDAPRRTNP